MAMCVRSLAGLLVVVLGLTNCSYSVRSRTHSTVFINSDDGVVHALNAATGKLIWQQKVDNVRMDASPVVADGLVIVSTSSAAGMYAFDALTGALRWKQTLSTGPVFSAKVADKTIYVLASHKAFWEANEQNFTTLYALDLSSGSVKWSFQAGKQTVMGALSNMDENCPLLAGSTVYFGGSDGLLYAVDASKGTLKWSYSSNAPFYTSPVWLNKTVYAGDANGSLLAINDSTGSLKWKIHDSFTIHAGISTDQKLLFVPYDGPATLAAYSPDDGKKRWLYRPLTFISSAPTAAHGLLYTGCENGIFYALDAQTGTITWEAHLLSSSITVATVVGDVIYVGGGNTLYALNCRTGLRKWAYTAAGNVVKSACVQLQNGSVFRGLGSIQPNGQ